MSEADALRAQPKWVITFSVPLPPPSLRANSRAHYRTKGRDADTYSRAVYGWTIDALHKPGSSVQRRGFPWSAAGVHYEWHYATTQPDLGNIPGNVKYLQDILCRAPASMAGANRFYLGLVDNDKHIIPTYSMVKEKRRAAERVEVRITRVQ